MALGSSSLLSSAILAVLVLVVGKDSVASPPRWPDACQATFEKRVAALTGGATFEGQPLVEIFDGILGGLTVSRQFDPLSGEIIGVELYDGETKVHEIDWALDADGRLGQVSTPDVVSGTYSYTTGKTTLQSNLATHSRVLASDGTGRLSAVQTQAGQAGYNATLSYSANGSVRQQSIAISHGQDTRWFYDYSDGQLQSARSNQADSLVYNHDAMGNRTAFSANTANQYQVLRAPNGSTYTVIGSVKPGSEVYIKRGDAGAGVTLGGDPVTVNADGSFRATFTHPSSSLTETIPIKVVAVLPGQGTNGSDAVSREDRTVVLAPSEGALTYGAHGALAGDPRWIYHWNDEGRLSGMETRDTAAAAGVENVRLLFVYDHEGRRIWKQAKHLSSDGTVVERTVTTRFVYDGWLLLAELTEDADNLQGGGTVESARYYTWGSDLGGSLQGAGGVGGLVAVKDLTGAVYSPAYDAAGNIVALTDASGEEVAYWRRGPFGELLESGGQTEKCPLGFATHYTDEETGLVYFGYRYYSPAAGRWLSREPLGEFESFNLYAYCGNDPISKYDFLGLAERAITREELIAAYLAIYREAGKDLLKTFHAGSGNRIVMGDIWGNKDLDGGRGVMWRYYSGGTRESIQRGEYSWLTIQIEEDIELGEAAMLLHQALNQSLSRPAVIDFNTYDDVQSLIAFQKSYLRYMADVTATAANGYLAALSVVNEGADWALMIAEVSNGNYSAAVGVLPFVPAAAGGLARWGDNALPSGSAALGGNLGEGSNLAKHVDDILKNADEGFEPLKFGIYEWSSQSRRAQQNVIKARDHLKKAFEERGGTIISGIDPEEFAERYGASAKGGYSPSADAVLLPKGANPLTELEEYLHAFSANRDGWKGVENVPFQIRQGAEWEVDDFLGFL